MALVTCIRCGAETLRARTIFAFCFPCGSEHSKEGWSAITQVRKAIRQGRLTPAKLHSCVDCGKPASDHEHRDYTRPLDVQPVCRSCNLKRGPAFDSKHRPASEAPPPSP